MDIKRPRDRYQTICYLCQRLLLGRIACLALVKERVGHSRMRVRPLLLRGALDVLTEYSCCPFRSSTIIRWIILIVSLYQGFLFSLDMYFIATLNSLTTRPHPSIPERTSPPQAFYSNVSVARQVARPACPPLRPQASILSVARPHCDSTTFVSVRKSSERLASPLPEARLC